MAYYIKANPLVAQHLHLTTERNMTADGNFLLWQADMCAFGPMWEMRENAIKIGAIMLTPTEAKEEIDGFVCRPLPLALDERFKIGETTEQQASPHTQEADPLSVEPKTSKQ